MTNIAVFASGTGSNAVNIVKSFNSGSRIRVALCLTDRENAPVIDKMKELGVETLYFPRSVWSENPEEILDVLRSHDIKVIALAGFLCYVSEKIVAEYEGRILNIHPSLLPAYGGKGMHGSKVHEAVLAAGETKSGATVHVVTDKLDMGPIVEQKEVPVLPDDTPESLEARVHGAEYELFPSAILKVVKTLGQEPPALPKSVDDAWAETLGVPNNVPPVPDAHNAPDLPKVPNVPKDFSGSNGLNGFNGFNGFKGTYPPFSPAAQPNTGVKNTEPMPKTWLVWSILFTIFCCFIPGIVAIVYSSKVSSRYFAGDIEGAKRASESAEIWIIISFVLGVIVNTLYLPLSMASALF